jgi:hypothetical protein
MLTSSHLSCHDVWRIQAVTNSRRCRCPAALIEVRRTRAYLCSCCPLCRPALTLAVCVRSCVDELSLVSSTPPPPHSATSPQPPPPPMNYPRGGGGPQQQYGRGESHAYQPGSQQQQQQPQSSGPLPTSDLQSSNWSLQQVQQLQSQILQLTNLKQKQEAQQQQSTHQQQQHTHPAHQLQQSQQSPVPPPLGLLSRPSSLSSYDESPRSSVHTTMSSPSHRSSFGFSASSTMSSPYDSVKSRSHSRSISSLGALNPLANEFNPTFSTPNSPSAMGHSPGNDRRSVHGGGGRAASSTPTLGFGSSASPPSSVASLARSIDSNLSGPMSPLAQQQQQQLIDEKLASLGLPSQPFDARELDAQIARERDDHAAYIYNFRVQVCQGFLDGTCPYDSYTCFQTHARLPRRRKPILQHGRFNYIPTRCRYVIEEKEYVPHTSQATRRVVRWAC